MSDENDISQVTESAEHIMEQVKEHDYVNAGKESLSLGKTLYQKFLKGKSVEIKGKKIPLTFILCVVAGLYAVFPSSNKTDTTNQTQETEKTDPNSYSKDGVKVYNMRKCDNAVCGILENENTTPINRILISLTYHDQTGAVVYEGGAEITDITERSRMQMTIPSEVEFAYFKLIDVTVEK